MSVQSSLSQADRSAILVTSLIIGVSLGLIQSGILFLSQSVVTQPSLFITSLSLVAPLIWAIGYLLMGIQVGKRTRRIGQGALSGLCAGTFAGLMVAMGQIILVILHLFLSMSPPPGTLVLTVIEAPSYLITRTTTQAFLTMGIILGAGAGFGVLGSLIGQYLAPERSQPKAPPACTFPYPTHDQVSSEPVPEPKLSAPGYISPPAHPACQQ